MRPSCWRPSPTSTSRWWNEYKYRFLPWIVFNLKKELKKQGQRKKGQEGAFEGAMTDEEHLSGLADLLSDFAKPDPSVVFRRGQRRRDHWAELHSHNSSAILRRRGFQLEISRSQLADAGDGVFVARGCVPSGTVAALYPGTIYEPGQPVLLQSLGNKYVLRCSDGVCVDGNHRGLSGMVFSSLHGRDRLGGHLPLCDPSWRERETK